VLGHVFERGRLRPIGFHLTQTKSDVEARRVVADELDEALASVTDESTRQTLYRSIVERAARR